MGYKYPVPENAPDEGVFIICGFNIEWLPFVIGALLPLKNPDNWDDPPLDISAQVSTLIDLIQTNLDP